VREPPRLVAHLDDLAVIEMSRREPEAFAEIFNRYGPAIKRYTVRRLGLDAAEDVVAETFLAAFRQRATYDPARAAVRPWLYGIAGNLIRRHVRTEVRHLRVLQATSMDPVMESFAARSDARMDAEGAHQRLAAALAELPDRHRDVLLLVAWGDLTYAEVAQTLDIKIGTVRSRMNRARESLRRALGPASAPTTQAQPEKEWNPWRTSAAGKQEQTS
jgi:RNA polymerase sigma factor (sigma-70 family)